MVSLRKVIGALQEGVDKLKANDEVEYPDGTVVTTSPQTSPKLEELESGTESELSAAGDRTINTNITDPSKHLIWKLSFVDDPGNSIKVIAESGNSGTGVNGQPEWDTEGGHWNYLITNSAEATVNVEWKVLEVKE